MLVYWVFLNSAVLWVVPGIHVCRRLIQWLVLYLKGYAKMIHISEGWNWHIVIPIVTAFHYKEGKCFKITMLVFLAYGLIFFFPLVCVALSVVLPPCSFICLQFCHFGFALSSWCVCDGWSGFWQMWTEWGGSVGAQPSLPESCLLQKVHLNAVCVCQVMWRGSTWEQEGAGLRVWVTRTCLGTIVIWEWCSSSSRYC